KNQIQNSPRQACRRVDFFMEQNRHFVCQRVPYDPSHNRGKHPHDGRGNGTGTKAERFFSTHNGEESNAKRIEKKQSPRKRFKITIKNSSYEHPDEDGINKVHITNPNNGIASKQHIAKASSTDGCNKSYKSYSKPIRGRFLVRNQRT